MFLGILLLDVMAVAAFSLAYFVFDVSLTDLYLLWLVPVMLVMAGAYSAVAFWPSIQYHWLLVNGEAADATVLRVNQGSGRQYRGRPGDGRIRPADLCARCFGLSSAGNRQ